MMRIEIATMMLTTMTVIKILMIAIILTNDEDDVGNGAQALKMVCLGLAQLEIHFPRCSRCHSADAIVNDGLSCQIRCHGVYLARSFP